MLLWKRILNEKEKAEIMFEGLWSRLLVAGSHSLLDNRRDHAVRFFEVLFQSQQTLPNACLVVGTWKARHCKAVVLFHSQFQPTVWYSGCSYDFTQCILSSMDAEIFWLECHLWETDSMWKNLAHQPWCCHGQSHDEGNHKSCQKCAMQRIKFVLGGDSGNDDMGTMFVESSLEVQANLVLTTVSACFTL